MVLTFSKSAVVIAGRLMVTRSVSKPAGNLCFFLDFLKGVIAAGWPLLGASNPVALGVLGLIAAIIGHSYSVFIQFRGGKGVAVTMGGLFALSPPVLVCALIVWGVVYYVSHIVSAASLGFGVSLPIFGIIWGVSPVLGFFLLVMTIYIVYKHRDNIKRILDGSENRFKKKE